MMTKQRGFHSIDEASIVRAHVCRITPRAAEHADEPQSAILRESDVPDCAIAQWLRLYESCPDLPKPARMCPAGRAHTRAVNEPILEAG